MAEIVTLVELNIDIDKAKKDAENYRLVIEDLKEGIRDLKNEEKLNNDEIEENTKLLNELLKAENKNVVAIGEATENQNKLLKSKREINDKIVDNSVVLKANTKDYNSNIKLVQDSISADNEKEGSIAKTRKELSIVSAAWAKLSKEERENTEEGKKLSKQKKDLTANLKSEEAATGDARRNVGNYTDGIGEAKNAVTNLSPALSKATAGATAFGVAAKLALGPWGLIIGAITLVVKSIQSFFTSSEKGQNALLKLQAIFDTVFGNLNDILSGIGEKLFSVFENPKEAIKDLGSFLKENIVNRFVGLLELIPNLGKAIGKLFKGDFSGAAKTAGDAVVKVTLGVADFSDKAKKGIDKATAAVKAFGEETKKEIAIAKQLADSQAKLDKEERERQILKAKLSLEVARLRVDAVDKERFSSKERIIALDAAIAKEKEMAKLNVDTAKERARIHAERISLSNSTKEDLDEQAQLEAEVFAAEEGYYNTLKRLESERQTTIRENEAEKNALAAEEQARKDAELKAEEKRQAKKVKASLDALDKVARAENQAFQNEYARLDKMQQAQKDNVFAFLDLEKKKLKIQKEQEIAAAKSVGAKTFKIEQKYNKASRELDRAKFNEGLDLASGFAGNIAELFGKQTKVGKAAAAAQIAIDTAKAAIGAYASLAPIPLVGPVLGAAAAGAAIAYGAKQIKSVYAVPDNPTAGLASVSTGGTPTAPSVSGNSSSGGSSNGDISAGIIDRSTPETNASRVNSAMLVVDSVTQKQQEQEDNKSFASI